MIPILHTEIEYRSEQLPKTFYEGIITLIPKKKLKTLREMKYTNQYIS